MSKDIAQEITVDWEDGKSDILSGAQLYSLIYENNNPWLLSANGTIFTVEKEGIIPGLLARWYKERKDLQKKLKAAIDSGNKVEEEYWDKRQLVKKINLNSLYGAILNPGCRFYDNRIGQSTTLTGRRIARHMSAKINEIITGEYNHVGKAIIYGDTDSVEPNSIIRTLLNDKFSAHTIEELFLSGDEFWKAGDKEYSRNKNIRVAHTNETGALNYVEYNYVYRHRVSKSRFKITTANGKEVIVTGDHSVMVLEDGKLVERKPADLKEGDKVITIM